MPASVFVCIFDAAIASICGYSARELFQKVLLLATEVICTFPGFHLAGSSRFLMAAYIGAVWLSFDLLAMSFCSLTINTSRPIGTNLKLRQPYKSHNLK